VSDRKLCNCKNLEDCNANSDAEDEWCRIDFNAGIFASDQGEQFKRTIEGPVDKS